MNELMTSRQQQEQQQHGSNQFGAVASNWNHFADVTGDDDDDASVLLITFKLIFSNGPLTHYNFFFWGNEQSTASFSVILGIFKAIIKKLQQINLKNYPSCTRCPDSNTQLLPHEVPRVTTRPGRLSSFPSSSHCTDKCYCHKNCFGFERFWKQLSGGWWIRQSLLLANRCAQSGWWAVGHVSRDLARYHRLYCCLWGETLSAAGDSKVSNLWRRL